MADLPQNASCLYELRFPNGKRYIGVTRKPKQRWKGHCDSVRRAKTPVQKAIKSFGRENVAFSILAIGPHDYILDTEILAISAFGTCDRLAGYNVSIGGGISPMLDPAIAAKQSASLRGYKHSPETREKVRLSIIGRKHSPETLAKMSASQKGRVISAEARIKIGNAHRGRSPSEEARAKMSTSAKGKPHPWLKGKKQSPEHRAKGAAARTGRIVSDAQRTKVRAALIGRPLSLETRAKLCIAQQQRWDRARVQQNLVNP